MTTDTKAIIGTIIGATALLVTLLGSRIDNVENEVRSLRTRIDAVETGLGARIDAVETGLGARINAVETGLGARINAVEAGLQEAIRENYHLLDERIRSIETGFARIDQRLETLERAVIPSAEPPE